MSKCPVDHNPVDHPRSSWSRFLPFSTSQRTPTPPSTVTTTTTTTTTLPTLSTARETSSIPKLSDGNWVYPSEAQFFAAMARKNHNPHATDMKTIVPIHNAVNERAWAEILRWENGRGGEHCGGVKLVNLKGLPGERSPKARWRTLLGSVCPFFSFFLSLSVIPDAIANRYSPPFDRHDWIVDRCGTRMRYVIDFYTGRSESGSGGGTAATAPSFYLDVRPALDSWEAIRMRSEYFYARWLGKLRDALGPSPNKPS